MNSFNSIRNMRRGLIALGILFPCLYALFAFSSSMQGRQAALDKAESEAHSIAAALNEHALRAIGEASSRMQGAIADIDRRGLSLPGPDAFEIHQVLKSHVSGLPQAVAMYAIDAQGLVRADGHAYPSPVLDVSKRPYFEYHLANAHGDLLISRSVKSMASGKWILPLTRRISNADGSLRMLILFAIDLSYFDKHYRTLQEDGGSRLLLLRKDGTVTMQAPLTEDFSNVNLAHSILFDHFRRAGNGAYREAHSPLDGERRIVGYAGSEEHPVIAVVSLAENDVLAPWRRQTWQIALAGLVSIAMLLTLIKLQWQRLNELARSSQALAKSEQRYHELVDGIDAIVWEATLPDYRFLYVSANAKAISGFTAEQWLDDPAFWVDKLTAYVDSQRVEAVQVHDGQTTVLSPVEHHLVAPDGREIWLRNNITIFTDPSTGQRLRGVMVDITAERAFEKQLYQLARHDQLTGLPNRAALHERIERHLARALPDRQPMAFVLIDMDNFKTINDSLGHEAGDQVLSEVAHRIRACLAPGQILARVGGDEFVVLAKDMRAGIPEVENLVGRIAGAVGRAIDLHGRELYAAISMGISVLPGDGCDARTLMRNADTALHHAKASGRNCWRFFDQGMADQVARRLELETALRRAVEREEFTLHFQPQHALSDGQAIGVEALLRWNRAGHGLVPPREFIPLAEESGMIIPIGAWVLQSACRQAVAWRREHGLRLRLAVNVAAQQILHKDFVASVRTALASTGMEAEMLELEITESSIIHNLDETISKLRQLKELGVSVAIDDFGTGYSSLSYLKQLPIDRLKIDRSFLRDIPADPDDQAIVRTIIAMARNLGLSVIAEGVETQAQANFLRTEGCHEIQGYLLSEPLPSERLHQHCARPAAPLTGEWPAADCTKGQYRTA